MVDFASEGGAVEPGLPSPAEILRAKQEVNQLTQQFHQELHALGVKIGDPNADQALAEMTKANAELQQSSEELGQLVGDLLKKNESVSANRS